MASISTDAALVTAYEKFRQLNVRGYGIGYSNAQHEAISAALDEPDAVLFATPPTTPHGVEVLLRRIASTIEPDRWFDRAIMHDDDETLRERLEELPGNARVIARCILALTASRHAAEALP